MILKTIYHKPRFSINQRIEKGTVLYEGKSDNQTYYLVEYSKHSNPEIIWNSELSTQKSYDISVQYEKIQLKIEEYQNDLVYLKKELQHSLINEAKND